jgi:hypothetical protein
MGDFLKQAEEVLGERLHAADASAYINWLDTIAIKVLLLWQKK